MYFSRYFNCHPILIQYLFHHGLENRETISNFFSPASDNFHDPFLLNDMKEAAIRIIKAIKNQEKILIFGDYDCDGITSTSILLKCLKKFGANAIYRLPLRDEGYGITPSSIREASNNNISLIITVDNGSSAHTAMNEAAQKGIDMIVTDHHEILGQHPKCFAFVNPKRHDNTYPFPELCGAGVAFKLVHALYIVTCKNWKADIKDYIELATLGTIADLMPLKGENRTICQLGFRKMNTTPSNTLKKIFKQLKIIQVNSGTIGFQIAPLFNALGRIDNPNFAVEVLTNESVDDKNIHLLIELNKRRKQMTQEQYEICETTIKSKNLSHNHIIIVYGAFHHGLIGILASKITEKFHKPAIVISENGTGSCRSVNGSDFSIINVLNRCKNHLIKYGGHQAAAGFSIEPNDKLLVAFYHDMQMFAEQEGPIKPIKHFFAKLSPQDFSHNIYKDILLLEPFGQEFSQPIFLSNKMSFEYIEKFGKNNTHAKLISPSMEYFYLFNKGENAHKLRNQEIGLFYSSTLNHQNEFIIHGIIKA
ncbi:single-stranded-DNA-specific exonuclease RecJ [Bacillus pacificus]|nr:single-stranded-DNA-specific exonuclease RecJ [Bacillus pacificus]